MFSRSKIGINVLLTNFFIIQTEKTPRWRNPEFVPRCLRSSLKVIEYVGFESELGEIEMAEYLIKNALVLEKMTIEYGWKMIHDFKERVAERLTECRRGSKACRIVFSP